MMTLCAFCEDPIADSETAPIGEYDDPHDRVEGDVAHDECLYRHRAAVKQTSRMFKTLNKDYDLHTGIEFSVEDVDEDELAAELDELKGELEGEMAGDE